MFQIAFLLQLCIFFCQIENSIGGEKAYTARVKEYLVPAIANFAAAVHDDSLWKTLNYQLMLKTRSSSKEVGLMPQLVNVDLFQFVLCYSVFVLLFAFKWQYLLYMHFILLLKIVASFCICNAKFWYAQFLSYLHIAFGNLQLYFLRYDWQRWQCWKSSTRNLVRIISLYFQKQFLSSQNSWKVMLIYSCNTNSSNGNK